jgi:nitrate/TMAO reductase-like tetraheme cytochrome c subunit
MAFPIAVLFLCVPSPSPAVLNDTCLSCHGQKGSSGYVDRALFEQSVHAFLDCKKCHVDISGYPHHKVSKVNCGICHFLGRENAPSKQAREYQLSVHGRAYAKGRFVVPTCQTCHGYHYVYPSSDPRSSTSRRNIPKLCSMCHPKEFETYHTSVHGKELLGEKNDRAATCFDCHLEHLTPPVGNDQWKLALIKECGTCHTEQMKSYRKTYHGQVTELGYATMAKCSDCHGSHNILRIDNPESTLSQKNILNTCRKCHPAATMGFTKFYAHPEESNRAKYPVLYYTYILMTTLLIGVFAFFLTHTSLWAYRSLKERMRKKGGG